MDNVCFNLQWGSVCLLEGVIHRLLAQEFAKVSKIFIEFAQDLSEAMRSDLGAKEHLEWNVTSEIKNKEACFTLEAVIRNHKGRIAIFKPPIWTVGENAYGFHRNYRRSGFALIRNDENYAKLIDDVSKSLIAYRDCPY